MKAIVQTWSHKSLYVPFILCQATVKFFNELSWQLNLSYKTTRKKLSTTFVSWRFPSEKEVPKLSEINWDKKDKEGHLWSTKDLNVELVEYTHAIYLSDNTEFSDSNFLLYQIEQTKFWYIERTLRLFQELWPNINKD